ncbi:hypothetical protein E2C01_035811 [Portunus trituberculatus]|uniref:Uncharacterized protein n=1 Tax=Portunus trituberculatus TaxID=210409 RepID=A0A5B7FA68_PORTR|nr:hypothetical protein [Portunus trituberculatus]
MTQRCHALTLTERRSLVVWRSSGQSIVHTCDSFLRHRGSRAERSVSAVRHRPTVRLSPRGDRPLFSFP